MLTALFSWRRWSMSIVLVLACGLVSLSAGRAHAVQQDKPEVLEARKKKLIPPDIQKVVEWAKLGASVYGDITSVVNAAEAIGKLLGVLPDDSVDFHAEFAAIHKHLNEIGAVITEQTRDLWAEIRLSDAQTAVRRATRYVEGMRKPLPQFSDEDRDTDNALNAMFNAPTLFHRLYTDDRVTEVWEEIIGERGAQDNQLGYDWRVGLAQMMELTRIRLHILKAMEPNFEGHWLWMSELRDIRQGLKAHYDRMVGGVKCGWRYDVWGFARSAGVVWRTAVCADIHTGFFAQGATDVDRSENECETQACIDEVRRHNEHINTVQTDQLLSRLRSEVMKTIPLQELSDLIHTIERYISQGSPEDFNSTPDYTYDILWRNKHNNKLAVWWTDGNGRTIGGAASNYQPSMNSKVVGTADFTGDLRTDLLVHEPNTGEVSVVFMMGANAVWGKSLNRRAAEGTGWRIVATADMDGNEVPDVVWQHSSGQLSTWLLNKALDVTGSRELDPGFAKRRVVAFGDFNEDNMKDPDWFTPLDARELNPDSEKWQVVAAGDFNEDNMKDLVWFTPLDARVMVSFMNHAGEMSGTATVGNAPGWIARGAADVNGDFHADLLWFNPSTGEAVVWFLEGTAIVGSHSLGTVGLDWELAPQ
jgi:hypothetical protein